MSNLIVGIDLGTTNSEIAAFIDGQVRVLGPGDTPMLPSCVGLSLSGELLVGEAARNQQKLYPERTIRSIKRKMGSQETVKLGDKEFSPQEISALILRELVEWAQRSLGERPSEVVITVPAYFSDSQRSATREAGALAGLEVVRILNEPTAASLAYGYGGGEPHTALVYDLGGGTFDVSVVHMEGDITEVLASHGNNHLGGDDFDDLLAARFVEEFRKEHGIDLRQDHPAAMARLRWAAEEAKKKLSYEQYVSVSEDALVTRAGNPLHLESEISRHDYEALVRPLIESTLDSVSKALQDAGKKPSDLDAILLVGGSTRTPLVAQLLADLTGKEPRQEVHPDLCVALGAGVMASRLCGRSVDRVLVDVSPYSYGISFLGERGGVPYPHCYKPIVRRNTPLPVTRTESYETNYPYQTEVELRVYQGDDDDALKNILVGDFRIEKLLPVPELNEILCRMRLGLDGILEVAAVEKRTGKTKHITITNALHEKSAEEIAAGKKRIQELYAGSVETGEEELEVDYTDETATALADEAEGGKVISINAVPAGKELKETEGAVDARELLERSRRLLEKLHAEDREEAIDLHERIESAIEAGDAEALSLAVKALKELLFFVEG